VVWLGMPATALASVWVVSVWQSTPYVALILLAGLRSLPSEPLEAAAIDGANRRQSFWHITLPLLRPHLLVALLLRVIFEFRAFDNIYALTGGGPANATMVLSMFTYLTSFVRFDFSLGAAASWAHFDDHLPVLYRDDPPAGYVLMAAVVGSPRMCRLQAGLVYAALTSLAALFLFPLFWVFGLPLKTRLQVFANPPLFIWWPTLENYVDVLSRSDFLLAFVNTLVVAGSAVTLSLCVGVPAAYAFARFPFTGRSFLFFALLVMRMLPPIAVLVPMYVLFSKLGLATTRLSVVLAYSTFALPLVVWIMRGFFED